MLSPYSLPQHCILYLHLRHISSQAVLYTQLISLPMLLSSFSAVIPTVLLTSAIAPPANFSRFENSFLTLFSPALTLAISPCSAVSFAGNSIKTADDMNMQATTASFELSIPNSAVPSVAVSTNPPAALSFLPPLNIPPTAAAGATTAARKA